MRLIPEQIAELRGTIEHLRNTKQELIASKSGKHAECDINRSGDNDRELIDEITKINMEISRIEGALTNAELVTHITDETAEVGTSFEAMIITKRGKTKDISGTLIETRIAGEGAHTLYAIESPFGKAIQGLHSGDNFSYQTDSGVTITGMITALRKSMTIPEEKQNIKRR